MKSLLDGLLVLVSSASIWSIAGVKSEPLAVLPTTCNHKDTLITCHDNMEDDTLKQLRRALLVDLVVDFVFLNTTKACSCGVIKLTKDLKDTDIAVLSGPPCPLSKFKKCGHDVPTTGIVSVSGLVVSPKDSRLKWAIKHHVTILWKKVKELKSAALRKLMYNAILKSVEGVQHRLVEAVEANGNGRLIYGSAPAPLVQETRDEEANKGPVDANLKAQLWDTEAEKHENKAKQFAERIKNTVSRLFSWGSSVVSDTKEKLKQKLSGGDDEGKENREDNKDQADMEADLENVLTQIKGDLSKNEKSKKNGKRRRRSAAYVDRNIPKSPTAKGRLISKDVGHSSLRHGHQVFPKRIRREDKSVSSKTAAFILPYKIFIGGDFLSLFDSVGIDLATSMESRLPQRKLPAMATKTQVVVAPAKSAVETSIDLSKQAAEVSRMDPVQMALLTEANAADNIDDLTEESVIDKLLDGENEPRITDYDKIEDSEFPAFAQPGEIAKAFNRSSIPILSAGVSAHVPAAAVASKLEEVFQDDRRRAREQDHIFKNFIVFIVSIIGIIIIFAVLVIMSTRKAPNVEDTEMFQKHRELQMLDHEQRLARRIEIRDRYDGVTPEASPISSYQAWLKGAVKPKDGQITPVAPRTPEELIMSREWSPSLHMDPPLLGGRHVVTEFDDPLYDYEPKTTVSERSRSPNWPYFLKPNYSTKSQSPPRDRYLNSFRK